MLEGTGALPSSSSEDGFPRVSDPALTGGAAARRIASLTSTAEEDEDLAWFKNATAEAEHAFGGHPEAVHDMAFDRPPASPSSSDCLMDGGGEAKEAVVRGRGTPEGGLASGSQRHADSVTSRSLPDSFVLPSLPTLRMRAGAGGMAGTAAGLSSAAVHFESSPTKRARRDGVTSPTSGAHQFMLQRLDSLDSSMRRFRLGSGSETGSWTGSEEDVGGGRGGSPTAGGSRGGRGGRGGPSRLGGRGAGGRGGGSTMSAAQRLNGRKVRYYPLSVCFERTLGGGDAASSVEPMPSCPMLTFTTDDGFKQCLP